MNEPSTSLIISKKRLWVGRIITILPALFLVFDAVMKIVNITPVVEAMTKLGFPTNLAPTLGIITLVCVALYLFPRTAVLGAILLTGFLGGAVATHVRVGDPLFSHILFPAYIGILIWVGLFLRDTRVAKLIPIRKKQTV